MSLELLLCLPSPYVDKIAPAASRYVYELKCLHRRAPTMTPGTWVVFRALPSLTSRFFGFTCGGDFYCLLCLCSGGLNGRGGGFGGLARVVQYLCWDHRGFQAGDGGVRNSSNEHGCCQQRCERAVYLESMAKERWVQIY